MPAMHTTKVLDLTPNSYGENPSKKGTPKGDKPFAQFKTAGGVKGNARTKKLPRSGGGHRMPGRGGY